VTPKLKLNEAYYGEEVTPQKTLSSQVNVPEDNNILKLLIYILDAAFERANQPIKKDDIPY
jgi:lipid-binding SYLF domain-containing protein